jgi:hypothetical protein
MADFAFGEEIISDRRDEGVKLCEEGYYWIDVVSDWYFA